MVGIKRQDALKGGPGTRPVAQAIPAMGQGQEGLDVVGLQHENSFIELHACGQVAVLEIGIGQQLKGRHAVRGQAHSPSQCGFESSNILKLEARGGQLHQQDGIAPIEAGRPFKLAARCGEIAELKMDAAQPRGEWRAGGSLLEGLGQRGAAGREVASDKFCVCPIQDILGHGNTGAIDRKLPFEELSHH